MAKAGISTTNYSNGDVKHTVWVNRGGDDKGVRTSITYTPNGDGTYKVSNIHSTNQNVERGHPDRH